MTGTDIIEALINEHHDIDTEIEEFLRVLEQGGIESAPLTRAFDELKRHIYLEEEFLFPPIRKAGLLMPIMVMIREHGELWGLMAHIESLLDGGDQDALRRACQQLLGELNQHNSKEEPIIYPHTALDLTDEETAALADRIAQGTLPSGWVCEAATTR